MSSPNRAAFILDYVLSFCRPKYSLVVFILTETPLGFEVRCDDFVSGELSLQKGMRMYEAIVNKIKSEAAEKRKEKKEV